MNIVIYTYIFTLAHRYCERHFDKYVYVYTCPIANRIPDLQRKINSKVIGLIFRFDKNIEKSFDVYEDYPKLYIKKYFKYKNKKIMFYYMKKKTLPQKPKGYYFKIMKNGYRQNNLKFINT